MWKEETHSYTMVPIRRISGFSFQVHREVVTTPWQTLLQKKKLGKTRVNRISVKYKFPFQGLRYTLKSPSVTQRSVSQKRAYTGSLFSQNYRLI